MCVCTQVKLQPTSCRAAPSSQPTETKPGCRERTSNPRCGDQSLTLALFFGDVSEIPSTSPVRSNKTCQAVPVFFPVVINNRGMSHPYSCLKEGYIYWKFRRGPCMYGKQQQGKPLSVTDVFRQQSEVSDPDSPACDTYGPHDSIGYFFFCFPCYISGVHHFWVRFFANMTIFQSNHRGSHILSSWMVHVGCVFVASIHLSRT